MLCSIEDKNEIYKEIVNRLKAGESKDIISEMITTICNECRPSSPLMCIELCPIWKLKREYHDAFESPPKHNITDILRTTKNSRCLKILEVLNERPYSLDDLKEALKEKDHHHSMNSLRNYIKPLVDAGFIKVEDNLYKITPLGENAYKILTKSEAFNLSIDLEGYDEKILESLLSSQKSYDELAEIVPKETLQQSLKRLKMKNLIVKSNLSGHTFYFKTKRRPTRKLSPIELKIFKALPKEGITARDLQEELGVNIRLVYKYLRRLRYKRHVKKEEKADFYSITDTGRSFTKSLNTAYSLIKARA